MLPVGGLLIALFVGWVLDEDESRAAYVGKSGSDTGYTVWRLCVRYMAPAAVATILLQNLGVIG
jgi:NSS family neurotransmitter:Na+ symporter